MTDEITPRRAKAQDTAFARKRRRLKIRVVACPECGAGPSEPCKRKKGGYRAANHRARVDAWRTR